ncbi:hypothetical protein GCK32_007653 [Trichostrongylus colubriformis]|uniref:Uncharacterized protein n=1 Tax=Trichostrongylus colubriformis TaxID=6319 RepID=A0AAN8FQB1_TRICO
MSDLEPDRLRELEKILLDDDHAAEAPLEENGSQDQQVPRKRVRGRASRNRRKRRRRSRTSTSSSSSSCTSSSESSETESDVHPLLDRKLQGREDECRKKYEPTSPLQEVQDRIPKKIEFASSVREAPEIAGLEKKKLRARVKIADNFLEHFDACAAGMYVGMEERMSYFERLPLVASPLATVPVLEEGLRVRSFKLPMDEQSMVADSECVLNAMNLLAISRNEAAEHRTDRADLYVKQAMELLGISVHDFNVRRRERFFRSYGVDPMKSVPNYRRLPIEERRSRQHRRDHTRKRHGNSSARKDRSQELRSKPTRAHSPRSSRNTSKKQERPQKETKKK